jgi:carboxyl-terminal processing protease
MTPRSRLIVLLVSAPILVFAIVGGYLGGVAARQEAYPHLRVFDDVFSLTTSNYVEDVNADKLMHGAMHGLADSLDADSAFLTAEQVRGLDQGNSLAPGDLGIDLTRQYYLRVIAVRDQSPAAKAGVQTGDFIRLIDRQPTREMSVWEGTRLLRGAPGSSVTLAIIRGNAADPHMVDLVRAPLTAAAPSSRLVNPTTGYLRIPEFTDQTRLSVEAIASQLIKSGARRIVIDVRSTARGPLMGGLEAARLFVSSGTLAMLETRGADRQVVVANPKDATITVPVAVLVDAGTSGAAELFASALSGNSRAELLGERTNGRAALQRLFKLPDGGGLWMSYAWYLTPAGTPIHERGLKPNIDVPQPDVEFGAAAPPGDPTLDKAVERLSARAAGGQQ